LRENSCAPDFGLLNQAARLHIPGVNPTPPEIPPLHARSLDLRNSEGLSGICALTSLQFTFIIDAFRHPVGFSLLQLELTAD